MVRRWSYLSTSPKLFNPNGKLRRTYFKKTFKATVRFKRFFKNVSKLLRRKYNLRKMTNTSYTLLLYSYRWAKLYSQIKRTEVRIQDYLAQARNATFVISEGASLRNALAFSKQFCIPVSRPTITTTSHLKHLIFNTSTVGYYSNSAKNTNLTHLYFNPYTFHFSALILRILSLRKFFVLALLSIVNAKV